MWALTSFWKGNKRHALLVFNPKLTPLISLLSDAVILTYICQSSATEKGQCGASTISSLCIQSTIWCASIFSEISEFTLFYRSKCEKYRIHFSTVTIVFERVWQIHWQAGCLAGCGATAPTTWTKCVCCRLANICRGLADTYSPGCSAGQLWENREGWRETVFLKAGAKSVQLLLSSRFWFTQQWHPKTFHWDWTLWLSV